MSTMYDRIVRACKERGVTPGYVCDELGMRRGLISDLKSGKTTILSVPKVAVLAEFLNVSTDYIINGKEMNDNLTQVERDLLYAFRTAPLSDKQNVMFMLRNYMPVSADEGEESAI